MASKTIHSGSLMLLDLTDQRKLDVYIASNKPTSQIKNINNSPASYTPDWSIAPYLVLTATVFLDAQDVTSEFGTTFVWTKKDSAGNETSIINSSNILTIETNELSSNDAVSYICTATYKVSPSDINEQGVTNRAEITFTQVSTGTNGVDGRSVNILGSYATAAELNAAHPTGSAGDAYIVGNRDLYVWSPENSAWVDVGDIQGPAGTPGTDGRGIASTEITYQASASGTQQPTGTWRSTIPTVADNQYLWTRTVITYTDNATPSTSYSVGKMGAQGAAGISAPVVFLNNENISFSADSQGRIASTTRFSDVIAYVGTTPKTPTIGTITGAPTGMTVVASGSTITITIANNTTLGSPSSNSGYLTIPVTVEGISTNLALNWSKINAGAQGADGQTYYVHIRYSANANGSGFTMTPQSNTLYMGTCSTTSSTAPTANTSYIWALIKGNNGANGINGSDGTSYYVHIRYRENEGDTELSTTPNNYMGVYSGLSVTAPVNASEYVWYNVKGSAGDRGEDAITFKIYSSNGYVLSKDLQSILLQTFAYKGSALINAGATYQWYESVGNEWQIINGATNAYYSVTHSNIMNNKSYMCTMTFESITYSDVITVEDKTDLNAIFTTKPTSYSAGDIWVVGVDYIPANYEVGTMLRAEHTNNIYADADWVLATKYDNRVSDIEKELYDYSQYFSFSKADGITMTAIDEDDNPSPFSATLSNSKLSFNQNSQEVAYISNNKMNITEAEIVSPLTITGKYSGNTMLQAPIINLGNFSLVVESNGSLSIVSNH